MRSSEFEWLTFDCYGTLIDWESGIVEAFSAVAGRPVDREALLAAYHAIEPAVEAERYRSYRDVLRITAARVAQRLGWSIPESRTDFLAESLPAWPPFPDTNPALTRIAASGVKLGILSNVDDDLLAGTRRRLEAAFDLIVTARQVGSYKPARGHFTEARARLPRAARWLHAAQSYFHDVAPCKALAIPVAWVNRKKEHFGAEGRPDRTVRDLTELADWIA